MKSLQKWIFGISTYLVIGIASPLICQQNVNPPAVNNFQSPGSSQSLKIAVLNTRKCMEDSKMSKQERVNLEKMKNQMESVLNDKSKAIQAIENKLRDEDYLDSLSEEAERELKHKRKVLVEEGVELNRQFSDNLETTVMKINQNIIDVIGKACKVVVEEMAKANQPIDMILTSEACTYFNPILDLTDKVLAKMDVMFENEQKEQAAKNKQ